MFAAPFFLLAGSGGGAWRRSWSAGLVHSAYDYLYRLEIAAYPSLGYHADWSLEDPRYVPQNAAIMFLATPDVFPAMLPDALGVAATPVCLEPGVARGLFDVSCPLAVPRDIGMSVLLTSPTYVLLLPALRRYGWSRLVIGAERLVSSGRARAMPLVAGLVVASIAVNARGIAWGSLLGW